MFLLNLFGPSSMFLAKELGKAAMEIGLIYSKDDPRQAEAREFVLKYVRERGILARIVESNQPVKSPTVIINGEALKEKRRSPRSPRPSMFPALADIARALDHHVWAV